MLWLLLLGVFSFKKLCFFKKVTPGLNNNAAGSGSIEGSGSCMCRGPLHLSWGLVNAEEVDNLAWRCWNPSIGHEAFVTFMTP